MAWFQGPPLVQWEKGIYAYRLIGRRGWLGGTGESRVTRGIAFLPGLYIFLEINYPCFVGEILLCKRLPYMVLII